VRLSELIAPRLRLALLLGLIGVIAVGLVLRGGSTADGTRSKAGDERRDEAIKTRTRLTARTRAELTRELKISQIEKNGRLGVYVQPVEGGPAYTYGPLQSGRTWSVIKVPIVVAYLRWRAKEAGVPDGSRVLTTLEQNEIVQTIRDSDNRAARWLYDRMAASFGLDGADGRIERVFDSAGETGITIPKTGLHAFGTTTWRLADAVDLFRALNDGELASPADTRYVLGLMSKISERDSWGLKLAYGPHAPVAFKGGWGPNGSQWDLEQVGIVGRGDTGYVIAIMFHTNGNSPMPDAFAAGRSMFNAVASIIAEQIPATPGPS
jgi:beta-lactamase family protein